MEKQELEKCLEGHFSKEKMLTVCFSSLLKLAKCDHPNKRKNYIQYVKKFILAYNDTPITDLIHGGIVPVLIGCVDDNTNSVLQLEAATVLADMTSEDTNQILEVVSANAIPSIIKLLRSCNERLIEQALLALGNIISESAETRDIVIKHNFIRHLLILIIESSKSITIMKPSAWIMEKLCQTVLPALPQSLIHNIITTLNYLLIHKDNDILINGVRCIAYISNIKENELLNIQSIIDKGILTKVVPLLLHKEKKVVIESINILGNIATGKNKQTQKIINTGVLNILPNLLFDPKTFICKETVRFVANITAGNEKQIQAVIDAELIPLILMCLTQGIPYVQNEGAWAISNLTMNANRQQIDYIIRVGIVPPFCDLLSSEYIPTIKVVLEGLQNMLSIISPEVDALVDIIEECGGLHKIEKLQDHENYEIYKDSYELIKNYFSEDSDGLP